MEKSSPVPLSVTVCGLPVALSVIVSVPVLAPAAVGLKKTPMAQLAPGARVLPQVLSEPKSPGLAATLLIVNGVAALFVTVTLCGNPVVPTYWLENVIVEGDTPTMPLPLPASAIACGLPGASSTMFTAAFRAPIAAGVNVTLIEQLAPAARLEPQLFVCEKSEAFVPATLIELIFVVL